MALVPAGSVAVGLYDAIRAISLRTPIGESFVRPKYSSAGAVMIRNDSCERTCPMIGSPCADARWEATTRPVPHLTFIGSPAAGQPIELEVENLGGTMTAGGVIVQAADDLYAAPKHPYTQALLSAVPIPDPAARRQRIRLHGEVPNPIHPPSGCHFHTRCPKAMPRCATDAPQRQDLAPGHSVTYHLYD